MEEGATYILQGVDALGGLLDLTANDLGDKLVGELRQSAAGGLTLHDLGHLLADGTDLRRAGVGGLLDLVGATLGEGDGEQANEVVIGGLHGNVGLDQRLPLADQGAQLVGGEIQAVEVGQAVLALNLVHTELDLAESVVLIVLQVREGDLEDTALQGVVCVLQTAGAVDKGLADTLIMSVSTYTHAHRVSTPDSIQKRGRERGGFLLAGLEGRGGLEERSGIIHRAVGICLATHLHRVLILSREGIDGPLLDTLLTLRQALVPKRARISRWFQGCEV